MSCCARLCFPSLAPRHFFYLACVCATVSAWQHIHVVSLHFSLPLPSCVFACCLSTARLHLCFPFFPFSPSGAVTGAHVVVFARAPGLRRPARHSVPNPLFLRLLYSLLPSLFMRAWLCAPPRLRSRRLLPFPFVDFAVFIYIYLYFTFFPVVCFIRLSSSASSTVWPSSPLSLSHPTSPSSLAVTTLSVSRRRSLRLLLTFATSLHRRR